MSYCMTESADERNLPMCKEIAWDLSQAYPGHSWFVRIDGGMLIIKNMAISSTAAMCRKFDSIKQDAGQRKRDVVMAAGEFLECARMHRGKYDGSIATSLEGLNKGKFQPVAVAPELDHPRIIT